MTTAPTPSRADALIREHRACMHPETLRAWASDAVDELGRLQADNEHLQGSLEAQRLISDRAIALAKELEARKPLPLSDDDRLRLRSDVARAIWDVMREHEDRCDHALEDVEPKHQVWDCADAAIKAVHGITGGSA
ncbi:hypothetical protein [Delftia lacustris]|uniref:hypothetical protein n=1 Tax=Delftia lacustris TaxID=558537 RepID=UPI0013142653|nr:hypothetical protein [Delftia lacustris]